MFVGKIELCKVLVDRMKYSPQSYLLLHGHLGMTHWQPMPAGSSDSSFSSREESSWARHANRADSCLNDCSVHLEVAMDWTYCTLQWITIALNILSLIPAGSSGESSKRIPDEQRLLNRVFRGNRYDNSIRPVFNATTSVIVKFGLTLIQIMDMVSRSDLLAVFFTLYCVYSPYSCYIMTWMRFWIVLILISDLTGLLDMWCILGEWVALNIWNNARWNALLHYPPGTHGGISEAMNRFHFGTFLPMFLSAEICSGSHDLGALSTIIICLSATCTCWYYTSLRYNSHCGFLCKWDGLLIAFRQQTSQSEFALQRINT